MSLLKIQEPELVKDSRALAWLVGTLGLISFDEPELKVKLVSLKEPLNLSLSLFIKV